MVTVVVVVVVAVVVVAVVVVAIVVMGRLYGLFESRVEIERVSCC